MKLFLKHSHIIGRLKLQNYVFNTPNIRYFLGAVSTYREKYQFSVDLLTLDMNQV